MAKLNLSPPWEIYYKKLLAFFAKDPEVSIVYDDIEQEIKIYVENSEKAVALMKVLPHEKEFGNVKVNITIVPANMIKMTNDHNITENDLIDIFQGNKAVENIKCVSGIMSNPLFYIVFKKEIVQYYTDDLGDYNGICSTLYQYLAKDIFKETPNIFYCTSVTADILKTGWL